MQDESEPPENIDGRFTEWFRNRPTSLEFWEIMVGESHLGCCFAGESFRSLLLRADMGESTRHTLDSCSTIDECVALHERNFTIELSSVTAIRLREGTRTRRARLTVVWNAGDEGETSWKLSKTSRGDVRTRFVRALAQRDALSDADIGVESKGFGFL